MQAIPISFLIIFLKQTLYTEDLLPDKLLRLPEPIGLLSVKLLGGFFSDTMFPVLLSSGLLFSFSPFNCYTKTNA